MVRSREKREKEREVSEQAFSGFMIFSVAAAAAVSTFFLAPLSEMSSSQVDPMEVCALNVETQDIIKQLT